MKKGTSFVTRSFLLLLPTPFPQILYHHHHHSMFKRKRDSDTQLNDDDNNSAINSSGNNNTNQDSQDHQQLACNDTAQTSVIDVENPKLFRQCTDPLEWNLIKYRDMRSTHARRAFGRVLYRMLKRPFAIPPISKSLFLDSSSTHVTGTTILCVRRSISLLLSKSKEMRPFCLRLQQQQVLLHHISRPFILIIF